MTFSMEINVNVLVQMLPLYNIIDSTSCLVKIFMNYDGACKFFYKKNS